MVELVLQPEKIRCIGFDLRGSCWLQRKIFSLVTDGRNNNLQDSYVGCLQT